jgi:transcriptional regulator with XRE-family HTH domain
MQTIIENKALQKKVGENIEQIRLQKKKAVKEMASLLGISDTGYRNIERGITEITLTKIFHIAAILKVHCSELLDIDGNPASKQMEAVGINKQIENSYKLRIQQCKDENSFLKKQIEFLESMLLKYERVN